MSGYDDTAPNDDLAFDFQTSGIKTEKDAEGSGGIPDGMYLAVVEAIEKDHQSKTPCFKFTFSVTSGPFKGRKVFERLFLTEKNTQRQVLFGSRLGLIAENEFDKGNVRKNWGQAIGKQVVIEVASREYDAADGSKKKATNLTYNGLFKTTDERVAHVVNAAGAPAAAPAAAAGKSVADEFSDL